MRFTASVCLCLAAHVASAERYTPRMFRPGGKYYVEPKYNSAGGISEGTRKEVGGILKGILDNLMKHKAALPQVAIHEQVAADIVQRFHLGSSDASLAQGLRSLYEEMSGSSGHGLQKLIADEKALGSLHTREQASVVLASVLQHVEQNQDAEYTPRMFRPGGKYYVAPAGSHGGISDATRAEVSGILKGILGNLMHHKAALPELASGVVQKYHLTDTAKVQLRNGLHAVYEDMTAAKDLAEKDLASVGSNKMRAAVALVLQGSQVTQAVASNASYTPGAFGRFHSSSRPNRFTGRGGRLGISDSTKNQVAGILKGILDNLMKHKAALSQVAQDITKKFQPTEEVVKQAMSDETELKGSSDATKSQVRSVLALVLKSKKQ